MRLTFLFLLVFFNFNNFVMSYMILETVEFSLSLIVSISGLKFFMDISLTIFMLYIMISVSVICFVILIRSFSSFGKNNFFNLF